MTLGFVIGSFLVWKKGEEEGYDEDNLMDGNFLVIICSLIGARLWYVFWSFSDFEKNLFKAFAIIKIPGFSWFGAFLAGVTALAIYCHRKKWDFFKTADLFVFGLCTGQLFGLVGHFFDGSFYGKATSLPWGIKFPGFDQTRHPSQLYLFLLIFLILRLLFVFDKNYRTYDWYKNKRGEASPGFLFLAYLMLFSIASLIVDFFRERDLVFWQISFDQFFWLLTFLGAAGFLYLRSGFNFHKKLAKIFLLRKTEEIKVLGDFREPIKRKKAKKTQSRFKKGLEAK